MAITAPGSADAWWKASERLHALGMHDGGNLPDSLARSLMAHDRAFDEAHPDFPPQIRVAKQLIADDLIADAQAKIAEALEPYCTKGANELRRVIAENIFSVCTPSTASHSN